MSRTTLLSVTGKTLEVSLASAPNECPYCHLTIEPTPRFFGETEHSMFYQIIFQCPNKRCQRMFFGYYRSDRFGWKLTGVSLGSPKEMSFDEHIASLSPRFVSICNQSYLAEQHGLAEVCGMGYRKALEFLIKDYLISVHPTREDEIKRRPLGKCIADDVTDKKTKSMAERAVWIGNDETHYVRLHENKDVNDLKALIEVTLHWITAELVTEEYTKRIAPKK